MARKPIRRLRKAAIGKRPELTTTEKQQLAKVQTIRNHPDFDLIVNSLREGIKAKDIARWLVEEAKTDHNENYLKDCINMFARYNKQLIKSKQFEDSIDKYVDARLPGFDAADELLKLYRVQKKRLAVDIQTEMNIGKLLDNTHKEVKIATEMLELIAKIQGKVSNASSSNSSQTFADNNTEVQQTLDTIRSDEQKRNKVAATFSKLVNAVNEQAKITQEL